MKLQDYAEAKATRVRFIVYFDQQAGDLSTLPASLRGSLSGPGALTAEIRVTKEGEFSKGEVEHLAESLPSVSGAEYHADLTVIVPKDESKNE